MPLPRIRWAIANASPQLLELLGPGITRARIVVGPTWPASPTHVPAGAGLVAGRSPHQVRGRLRSRAGEDLGPRRLARAGPTPVGACWLNLQEGRWRIFRKAALAGQSFAGRPEIEQATRLATSQLNARSTRHRLAARAA